MRDLVAWFVLTMALLGTVSAQNASKRGLVGNLKDNSVADGCGCYFMFRSSPSNASRYIFASSIEEGATAWMNIGGRDVKLTEKDTRFRGQEIERVGSRSTAKYAAGDISVIATYVATRVCDPNDEDCESTQYDVTFVVKKGAKSQVVKGVGSCGC